MEISQITKIENGKLYFLDNLVERPLDLRESANSWYDANRKPNFLDKLLRKRKKNKYAGERFWTGDGIAYMKFFHQNEEYSFFESVNEANYDAQREQWDKVMSTLHKEGFWLFDMG